jgi:hypothetical protein
MADSLNRSRPGGRHRIVYRAAEGQRIAKAKGKSLEQRHTLNPEQRQAPLGARSAGESAHSIASRCCVGHSTIGRLRSLPPAVANRHSPGPR